MKIHISYGNAKVGKIMNISLPPVKTCREKAPCAKRCYALKAYNGYAKYTSKPAWDDNLRYYQKDPYGYFFEISRNVSDEHTEFVRWHVSGDIPDIEYLTMMAIVAASNPYTRFLAFTKQYEIVNEYLSVGNNLPCNLQVVFSGWPGLDLPNPTGLPIAYMQDGTESRITENDLHCQGKCDTCGSCWSLGKIGRNVWFTAH